MVEVLYVDKSITNRITPLWKIHCVCKTKDIAIDYLHYYSEQLKEIFISSHVHNEILYIDHDAGFNIGKRFYILRNIVVYGDDIHDYVYHLIRYNGYENDYDKPYRYDSLGWFSSAMWGKQTKEWKIYSYLIEHGMIGGRIFHDHIRLDSPYDVFEMPKLYIEKHKIIQ